MSTKAAPTFSVVGGVRSADASAYDDLVGAVCRYIDSVVGPLREKIAVHEAEIAALKARPEPAPGRDGVGVAGAFIDRDGQLVLTLSDGTVRVLGVVVGKDGEPGLGFDDLEVVQISERRIAFRMTKGEKVKEFPVFFPVPLYKDIYREGIEYLQGDTVTFGGSLWICKAPATTTKPGSGNPHWVLGTKHGRDGKDGRSAYNIAVENGFKGSEKEWLKSLTGPPGSPGRDLRGMVG